MIRLLYNIFINNCLRKIPTLFSIYNFIFHLIIKKERKKIINFSYCPVCGKKTIILIEKKNLRETCICFYCTANARNKAITEVLKKVIIIKLLYDRLDFLTSKVYIEKDMNLSFKPLKSILDLIKNKDFYIYEPSSLGATYSIFKKFPNFIYSEYFPYKNLKPGEYYQGKLFQDLQTLTFKDNSFDIVITQDVFEHIKDPIMAFKEIHRVLKPHGFHIFTVPFENREKTIRRIDKNNRILIKPIIFHNDNIRIKGPVVYNDFGYDLIKELNKMNFPSFILSFKNPNLGIMKKIEIVISYKIN